MSSVWKNKITFSLFGEAQGPAIGAVIDNLPAGEHIDMDEVRRFLQRRSAKPDEAADGKSENNLIQIMSGMIGGRLTGAPLCAFITNNETVAPSYADMPRLARSGNADYTGAMRYRGFNDTRDGGHLSERLTAPLVFAGAVCSQILERRGIYIGAHILRIHDILDDEMNNTSFSREDVITLRRKSFPVLNSEKGELMREDIRKAADGGEALGGIVECIAVNVPAGIGSPMFDGIENSIAQLVFGIPAVKGVEFGAGFRCAEMVGSQNNDEFCVNDRGHIVTKTNNHGGILGGISSGMPIVCRAAFRPAPASAKPHDAVDYSSLKTEAVSAPPVPCTVPNAVPCMEAAVSIAILTHMLDYPNF